MSQAESDSEKSVVRNGGDDSDSDSDSDNDDNKEKLTKAEKKAIVDKRKSAIGIYIERVLEQRTELKEMTNEERRKTLPPQETVVKAVLVGLLDDHFLGEYSTFEGFGGHKIIVETSAVAVACDMINNMVTKLTETAALFLLAENRGRVRARKTFYEGDFELALHTWKRGFGNPANYAEYKTDDFNRTVRQAAWNRLYARAKPEFDKGETAYWKAHFAFLETKIPESAYTEKELEMNTDDRIVSWRSGKTLFLKNIINRRKLKQKEAKANKKSGGADEDVNDEDEETERHGDAYADWMGLSAPTIRTIVSKVVGTYRFTGKGKQNGKQVLKIRLSGSKGFQTAPYGTSKLRAERYGCYNFIRQAVAKMLVKVLAHTCEFVRSKFSDEKWSDKSVAHKISGVDLAYGFQRFGTSFFI